MLAAPADSVARPGNANGVGTPFELSFWESVANSNDPAQFEAYLAQYPQGTFSGLARAKIAALAPPAAPVAAQPASVPAITAPPPAPVAAPLAAIPAPPPVVAPPVAQAVPATPAPALSLLEQLTAVGKGPQAAPTALFTETGPVPARPTLSAAAAPALPDHFCSAAERNSYHDSVYVPAVAVADRNNEATIAHLKNVQALHGEAIAAKNIAGANALAREATAFKPVADEAYGARAAMTELFARIMAVPVKGC